MASVSFKVNRSSVVVLTRALAHADAEVKREGTLELTTLGQLVERDAEVLATGIGVGRSWSQFRTGVSPSVVWVAPQSHGTKLPARKRPNFARLLRGRAMQPALDRRRQEVYDRFQKLTARVCAGFNHG